VAGDGAATAARAGVTVAFDDGWTPQQWTHTRTWRWALDRSAGIAVRNETGKTVRLEFAFLAQSAEARTLTAGRDGAAPQQVSLAAGRTPVRLAPLEFPPGVSRVVLTVDGGRGKSADGAFEQVTWRLIEPRVRRLEP
jgi:hypothetical protein